MTRENAKKKFQYYFKMTKEENLKLIKIIDKIYDELEKNKCVNCEYFVKEYSDYGRCRKYIGNVNTRKVHINFGCNEFKPKEK